LEQLGNPAIMLVRAIPELLRSDNGPEITANGDIWRDTEVVTP
jgi:hypothetical protein